MQRKAYDTQDSDLKARKKVHGDSKKLDMQIDVERKEANRLAMAGTHSYSCIAPAPDRCRKAQPFVGDRALWRMRPEPDYRSSKFAGAGNYTGTLFV